MKIPLGFALGGIHCGIKKRKVDLGLILCRRKASACGFFTNNANLSYSVVVSKENINRPVKALIVNSGNANCFSHSRGIADTKKLCSVLAKALGVDSQSVLIASTGIIAKKLPFNKIARHLPKLINSSGRDWINFSQSILTTDTSNKVAHRSLKMGGREVRIIGFAKGAGMISPTMATMLAFILTDAAIDKRMLKAISRNALADSFNAITVDGCMSTNDSLYVLASGESAAIKRKADLDKFSRALKGVFLDLAKMIVKDGEGASKFIQINVAAALNKNEAKTAGLAIANSSLFRTAIYGENANWGRIVAALGQAGIEVKEDKLKLKTTSLRKREIVIDLSLGRGVARATVYASDLTPDYIKINAEYS